MASPRPTPRWNVERLVRDMTLRCMNAQTLAARAGVTPKTVNRFLDGSTQTTKTAGKIAGALGYSVKRYLVRIETPEKAVA